MACELPPLWWLWEPVETEEPLDCSAGAGGAGGGAGMGAGRGDGSVPFGVLPGSVLACRARSRTCSMTSLRPSRRPDPGSAVAIRPCPSSVKPPGSGVVISRPSPATPVVSGPTGARHIVGAAGFVGPIGPTTAGPVATGASVVVADASVVVADASVVVAVPVEVVLSGAVVPPVEGAGSSVSPAAGASVPESAVPLSEPVEVEPESAVDVVSEVGYPEFVSTVEVPESSSDPPLGELALPPSSAAGAGSEAGVGAGSEGAAGAGSEAGAAGAGSETATRAGAAGAAGAGAAAGGAGAGAAGAGAEAGGAGTSNVVEPWSVATCGATVPSLEAWSVLPPESEAAGGPIDSGSSAGAPERDSPLWPWKRPSFPAWNQLLGPPAQWLCARACPDWPLASEPDASADAAAR